MTAQKQRRIVVTGAGGQLGHEIGRCRIPDVQVIGLKRTECDIANAKQVAEVFARYQPAAVVNAAAYTAVDKAESEPDEAFRINAEGVANVVASAIAVGARVVHVSTDYVFDGSARHPYAPTSAPNPLGVYGASKLAGERVFTASGVNGAIVRTAWLYAAIGNNFLKTILGFIRSGKNLRVVADQVGTPTSAASLAPILLNVAIDAEIGGIVHWTNSGIATWYEFAAAIQEIAMRRSMASKPVNIVPISTSDYPTAARRPPYSVLDCSALWERYGNAIQWRTALENVFETLPG